MTNPFLRRALVWWSIAAVLGIALALALALTHAEALPITTPDSCAPGQVWHAFDVGGTCLKPRTVVTGREVVTGRTVVTGRPVVPTRPLDAVPETVGVPSGLIGGGHEAPPLHPTPEPTTLILVGTTLAAAGWYARRRRK